MQILRRKQMLTNVIMVRTVRLTALKRKVTEVQVHQRTYKSPE